MQYTTNGTFPNGKNQSDSDQLHFNSLSISLNIPLQYGAAVFVYLVIIIAPSLREDPGRRVLVVAVQVQPQAEDEVLTVIPAIRGVRHLGVPILVIVSLPNFNRLA